MRHSGEGLRCIQVPAAMLLAALALTVTSGCSSMGGTSGGQNDNMATASAVRDPVLQDIPKPAGFTLAADRSVAIASGRSRLARCEYDGGLSPAEVKRFYEEYMPSANFELRRWTLDQGQYTMYFESGTELCTIRARPSEWRKTAVVVEITPKPQGSTDRESKPPMRRPQ